MHKRCGWGHTYFFIVLVGVLAYPVHAEALESVYNETWESGQGDWDVSNGVWGVGDPSEGPSSCYAGARCAGSVLNGNYPTDTDSRLISPSIDLPSVAGMQTVVLRFWQWFSYHAGDSGVVQISGFDAQNGWSAFSNASDSIVDYSGGWSRIDVDLTEYAGKKVRIGFLHVAKNVLNGVDESAGWFIDDVSVQKFLPAFDGGFEGAFLGDIEGGWSDWSASRGVWQVGTPSNGPDTCFVGNQCMGTRQDSIYPSDTDTRLVSVAMNLPSVTGEEQVRMRFWQWFSYHAGDSGVVQVSEYDAQSGWSAFSNASDSIVDYSAGWSRIDVDLTEYAGKKVRIGFLHVAKNVLNGVDESAGWFIDEISMVKKQPDFFIHPDSGIEYGDFEGASEGDVSGGWADWSASRGVWQVGAASLAPDKCHSGKLCVGTVLDVNYPSDTDSRLVSPPIVMPADAPAVALRMRFWHWHSYHSGDSAVVQISVFDESTGWSAWESLADGGPFVGLSSGWTRKSIDLLLYAGKKIRIGFLHSAANVLSGVDESSGWFIDNIKLPGVFLRPCEGDFDNDGDVDNSNTAIFSANFGRTNCSLDVFCEADFSGDGDVDNSDVFIFSQDFGDTMCFDN